MASKNAKYLVSTDFYKEKTEGILSFSEKNLEFRGKRQSLDIPIDKIIDAKTEQTGDLTKVRALGLMGLVMNMSKVSIMTVIYKDTLGGTQSLAFTFLPRTIKEVNFMDEAAATLNTLRSRVEKSATSSLLASSDRSSNPSKNVVTKEREIIREKEIIVKIRCSHCRGVFDETLDKCPHCGAPFR